MSETEVVKEASYQKDASWKKDIRSKEQPLSVLTEVNKTEVFLMSYTLTGNVSSICVSQRNVRSFQKKPRKRTI